MRYTVQLTKVIPVFLKCFTLAAYLEIKPSIATSKVSYLDSETCAQNNDSEMNSHLKIIIMMKLYINHHLQNLILYLVVGYV